MPPFVSSCLSRVIFRGWIQFRLSTLSASCRVHPSVLGLDVLFSGSGDVWLESLYGPSKFCLDQTWFESILNHIKFCSVYF